MIAWTDSAVPTWVRVEDIADTDHPTAVKFVIPCGAITARSTRHLGVVYTGQPCGIEIVCHDIDDANTTVRHLMNALDSIRWNRRAEQRVTTVAERIVSAEAERIQDGPYTDPEGPVLFGTVAVLCLYPPYAAALLAMEAAVFLDMPFRQTWDRIWVRWLLFVSFTYASIAVTMAVKALIQWVKD